ncbi:MAG: hypothetical protein QOJ85_2594 [Solirubrobacteraceae bacterium]|jgi:hypothetical protein|nr:hypothetical protein [Solirubrobacteraceae bacterium]
MRHGSHETTPSVFEVVRRAVDIVDPEGVDDEVAEFLRIYEDRDEPVTALGTERTREFFEAADGLMGDVRVAPVIMAAAVSTYLAFRRDEVGDDPEDILRLAARAEFGRHTPQDVADWLGLRGVEV